MSGGAFDYRQRYFEDIADDIEQEIMKRAVRFPKRYGYVFRSIPTHEEFHTFFVAGSYTAQLAGKLRFMGDEPPHHLKSYSGRKQCV